ncbi:hypothetical protein MNBD_GAMMA21-2337 [hydrothermal vent metagenome]|uniref:Uncharacterized protein n=1 Tax=hydrothermal vent metagenome TaxID=652676 RepID=A0A3B1B0E5_9ZZZZ
MIKISKRSIIVVILLLGSLIFALVFYCRLYLIQPITISDDHLEVEKATVYGTLSLTEKIDGERSGMITHDLSVSIDSMEINSPNKSYATEIMDSSKYKILTWKVIKGNILDEDGIYIELNNLPKSFKNSFLNKKISITGRIYKHCFNTYYLNPLTEPEPKGSFVCIGLPEQYHIRLSEYPK